MTTITSTDLRNKSIGLYTPPFRFEHGYIWDAKGQMVADNHVDGEDAALRVRGWGRISYMENPEALQDEVGNVIALAMTEFWERRKAEMDSEPVAWTWHYREQWHVTNDERRAEFVEKDGDVAVLPLYRHAQPAPDREQIRNEHAEWSQSTFGNVGPIGPLKHLSKEALEAAADPSDLSEWADMQFLLWDAQQRADITDEQITQAMIEKLAVNKQREWPEPKDGEPRLHIKDQPSAVGPVTDAMAYAFHHALTDGPLGDDDVEDIKIGLRAAFANVTTYQPLPVVLKEHQIRELVNKLRDIAIEYHGTQQLREHIACVIRTAMSAVAPPAPKSAVI